MTEPMVVLEHGTLNVVYHAALEALAASDYPQASRNGRTAEWHPAVLRVTDVRYRSLCLPQRRKNLLLQLVEFLWIWHGSHALAPVAAAEPRWRDYSDDGITLWGAYGARLRAAGINGIDQLQACITLLQAQPDTRQAVCTLWDGGRDLARPHKDLPCNNWLHFLVRDGKLDLTVVIRSNDLWWGVPYNAFNWMQLQCVVAARVGLPPGTYTHFADSLHLYERHTEAYARTLRACQQPAPDLALPVDGATDVQLRHLWRLVEQCTDPTTDLSDTRWALPLGEHSLPPYWSDYAAALLVGFWCKLPAVPASHLWSLVELMQTPLQVEAAQVLARSLLRAQQPHPEPMDDWLSTLPEVERRYVVEG